jgi:hypothetical protein
MILLKNYEHYNVMEIIKTSALALLLIMNIKFFKKN